MSDHQDDIFIGENHWIEFINLEGRYHLAVEIDPYLNDLWPLIERLETDCVAACCGFDAFDFTSEAIHMVMDGLDRARLLTACDEAQRNIRNVPSTVVVSKRMNNLADKQVMLQLIGHIHNCISSPAA